MKRLDDTSTSQEFEVEQILSYRIKKVKGKYRKEYLIKWKDYDEISWEPEQNLTHCQDLLNEYNKSQKLNKKLYPKTSKKNEKKLSNEFILPLDNISLYSDNTSNISVGRNREPIENFIDIDFDITLNTHIDDYSYNNNNKDFDLDNDMTIYSSPNSFYSPVLRMCPPFEKVIDSNFSIIKDIEKNKQSIFEPKVKEGNELSFQENIKKDIDNNKAIVYSEDSENSKILDNNSNFFQIVKIIVAENNNINICLLNKKNGKKIIKSCDELENISKNELIYCYEQIIADNCKGQIFNFK